MSTRFNTKRKYGDKSIDLGYSETGERVDIPSCGIEDIDRAFFNLFDKDIPIVYAKKDGEIKKVPIVFATGERFAINRRKEPVRDKNGALIIPLVTISRTGLDQKADRLIEMGDIGTIDIKRRLSKEDAVYQRLINSQNFKNVDEATSRRENQTPAGRTLGGRLLEPNLGVGIYETITIPTPKFFTLTYEITIWTQYVQHSNDILTLIMSSYHNVKARTCRIETDSGYWFVATFDSDVSTDNTFDNMTDDERIIKNSLKATVQGFIINPKLPGIPSGVRKLSSATQISFEIINGVNDEVQRGNVQDMRIDGHILDNIATVDDPVPLQAIGSSPSSQSAMAAGGLQTTGTSKILNPDTSVGETGTSSTMVNSVTRTLTEDPITGQPVEITLKARRVSNAHGEEVLTNIRKTFKTNNDSKSR
jgi:hypothetical protein